MSSKQCQQFIRERIMHAAFPNVDIALRIYCTLPVSNATGERSFSKLAIIKSRLRSTMGEDRLCNLSRRLSLFWFWFWWNTCCSLLKGPGCGSGRVIYWLSINIKYNTTLFDICAANKTKANYLHGVGGRGTWSWWWLSEAASASWSWAVAGSAAAPIASAPGPCPCLRPK